MKKILLLSILSIIWLISFAQEQESEQVANKSFFAELGGPGILFSANIDSRFNKSPLGLGGRIGVGFVTVSDFSTANNEYGTRSVFTFPLQLNYVFGKPTSVHAFEVGAGLTFTSSRVNLFDFFDSDTDKGTSVIGTAAFMYRRIPKDGGFSWRTGFTPLIAHENIQASGAVSVGYNF